MISRLMLLTFAMLVTASACERQKEERGLPRVDFAAQADQGNQRDWERDRFASEVQREVDELAARIEELRGKALSATGKAREKIEQQIAALEQEQNDLEEKLTAMKAAMGDKWKEFKEDIAAAISKFRQSVKNAM